MSFARLQVVCLPGASYLLAANMPAVDLSAPGAGTVATTALAGGKAANANYDKVSGWRTGHAESAQITYDPSQISYGRLLQIFFPVVHHPTQIDRQGPDFGSQYRSVIFYTSEGQEKVAPAYISRIEHAHVFHDPIATHVLLLPGFFSAEDHHQHYLQQHPDDSYIVQYDVPKLQALEQQFPDLVKP